MCEAKLPQLIIIIRFDVYKKDEQFDSGRDNSSLLGNAQN